MMTYWLVIVSQFSVKIEAATMLAKWDWSCEIEGVVHCYRVTSGYLEMPPNGQERAQIELMYHARNLANGAPVQWKTRGRKEKAVTKKKAEIQKKMKRMF